MAKKEIVVKETTVALRDNSADALIKQAIEKGTDVATMEKLLAMRKELKAEWSKEQFDKAMAKFQNDCPIIKKEKAGGKTNSGEVAYYYAPLESIVEQVKEKLNENGFSYSIQTKTDEKGVKVTCIAKHVSGHSESSDIEVPLGAGTRVMSAPQIVASALTFAKRYAFCNAFGILTGDDDNDGKLDGKGKDAELRNQKGFEMIKNAIKKMDGKELGSYREKVEKSDKYSAEQKEMISKEVELRFAEINAIGKK